MTKKVSAKPVNKAAKKKTTKVAKKTIAKKPTTKKVVSKKTATKKVPAEKVPIRRTASKKSVEKKMVTVSPQIEENLDLGLVETYKSEAIEVMPEEKETAIDAVEMMETAVLVGAERADLEDEDLEYFVQPEVTVESDTQLTVTLSATLLKKLTSAAEEEGVSTDQFATELITEGVVLRAWEIIERKAAMRGPSYNQNTKPQGPRNNNHRSSGSSSSSSSSNSSSSSSNSRVVPEEGGATGADSGAICRKLKQMAGILKRVNP